MPESPSRGPESTGNARKAPPLTGSPIPFSHRSSPWAPVVLMPRGPSPASGRRFSRTSAALAGPSHVHGRILETTERG